MPRNPEWVERNFKARAAGILRRDPWPEGYHMVLRARMLTREDLVALARRWRAAWPIPTSAGTAYTPEQAAMLWQLGDEWVTDTSGLWQPPWNFTGTVVNPDGELEHRVNGRFKFRDPQDRPGAPVVIREQKLTAADVAHVEKARGIRKAAGGE